MKKEQFINCKGTLDKIVSLGRRGKNENVFYYECHFSITDEEGNRTTRVVIVPVTGHVLKFYTEEKDRLICHIAKTALKRNLDETRILLDTDYARIGIQTEDVSDLDIGQSFDIRILVADSGTAG